MLVGGPNPCYRPDNARRELFAEVIWSALHGIVVLADSGRIPPDGQQQRLELLITQLSDNGGKTD